MNNSPAPVNPATPFDFEMPAGATGTSILQGSSPLASVSGPRVIVSGPFPPGSTLVQVGAQVDTPSGALNITQRFPAPLEEFAVIVEKVGDTKLASPQITEQREVAAQGETLIAAPGTPVAAGQPLTVSVTGMPHHSPTPRYTALTLALGILVAASGPVGTRGDTGANAAERKRLIARREKLLGELVRLERRRTGQAALRRAPRRDPQRPRTHLWRARLRRAWPRARGHGRRRRVMDFDAVRADRRLAALRPAPRPVARFAHRSPPATSSASSVRTAPGSRR